MNKLIKARSSIRMLITKTTNELEVDLAAGNNELIGLKTKYSRLNGYLEQISAVDQEILDAMLQNDDLSQEDYDAEVLLIDGYLEKIVQAKLKIDEICNRTEKIDKSIDDDFQSIVTCKRRFKLPKIELQKFSGKIIDWLNWWALFDKIDTDEELNPADKFQYLIQSIEEKTRAYEVIKGFPATADNYPKAIAALKDRFGNKNLLTQVYIRELFQMGLKNLHDKPEISTIYDKLVGHVRSLESLGITVEQSTLFLFPMVESSLPEEMMIAWQRSTLYEKDGSIESPPKSKLDFLLEFLRQEVEREEQRRLAKSGFLDTKESNKSVQKKKEQFIATAAGLHVGNMKPECIFCGKRHPSQDCYSAKELPLEEKWKIIKLKKVCGRCLKQGHFFMRCKEFIKCSECQKKHYPLLCPESSKNKSVGLVTSNSGSNNIATTVVVLKTILVAVDSIKGPIIVRALFDDGSHRSYITTRLANEIKGKEVGKFYERNTLFGGILSDIEERTVYEISLGPINQKPRFKLEMADKEKITGQIQKLPKGFWLQELKKHGIWINDYGSNNEEPDILIGADLIPKLTTDHSVTLESGLKAIKTVFGWTIMGPIPQTNQSCLSIAMSITTDQIDDAEIKQL